MLRLNYLLYKNSVDPDQMALSDGFRQSHLIRTCSVFNEALESIVSIETEQTYWKIEANAPYEPVHEISNNLV